MKKLNLVLAILGIMICNLFFGCKKNSNMYFVQKGKLTVVTSSDFAPFEFIDLTATGQNKYAGADMELARYLAKELNLTLSIKAMSFDVLLSALDSNKADLAISAISYDENRATSYLLSSSYYNEGDGEQVLVIKASDIEKFPTLESINQSNYKIAAQNGSIQYDIVKDTLTNVTLVGIDDLNNAYTLLESGQYDAVAVSYTVAETLVSSNHNLSIAKEYFDYQDLGYFCIAKKNNTQLMEKVNDIISKVKKDDLYTKWIENAKKLFSNLGENAGEIIPEEDIEETHA